LSLLAAAAAAGCQSYAPAPLDGAAHRAAWAARDPSGGEVGAYARQLAETRGVPAAFDPGDGFDLREAEVVALFFNPQLRAARAKARVPAAGAAEAGRWADPELNVNVERIIQGVENPWVLGGMVGFTIPLSGRLSAERGKAVAEADAARVGVLVDETSVLADLAARRLALAVLDDRVRLIGQYLGDLDGVAGMAEKLRQQGDVGPIEARLFKVEQVRRRAELRGLELRRRELEMAVKGVMGLVPEAPVRLVPSIARPAERPVAAGDPRRWLEEHHPRLRQARAEYAVAERALELETRKQYPDVGVGGGLGVDEGDTRLLGGLTIPLPVFNANLRAIAEARAARDAARAGAEATYEDLAGALARARVAVESAREQRELLERELAPLVDEQLRDARKLGRLGDATALVLLEALTRAFETKVEVLDAVEREAAAGNQLDELLRGGGGVAPGDARAGGKP
jgi:cobalt-zinc-cadmium efflux system outer membrane protein